MQQKLFIKAQGWEEVMTRHKTRGVLPVVLR